MEYSIICAVLCIKKSSQKTGVTEGVDIEEPEKIRSPHITGGNQNLINFLRDIRFIISIFQKVPNSNPK